MFTSTFLQICLLLFALCCITLSQQVFDIQVLNVADSAPTSSDCLPVATANAQCNLRSAWQACSEQSSTDTCRIHLPVDASIVLDRGALTLTTQHVEILGNEATISNTGLSSRFIEYTTDGVSTAPTIAVSNTTVQNFGDTSTDGGAVYLDGPAHVSFDSVVFQQNSGRFGAAVSASNNNLGTTFSNCKFVQCNSALSGAVSLYQSMVGVNVINSVFESCVAGSGGGGLYVATNTMNLQVNDTLFADCQAADQGGAVLVGSSNSFLTFNRVTVTGGRARGGGAMYVSNSNSKISFTDLRVVHCSASGFNAKGGGLYFGLSNSHVSIVNARFERVYAANLGGAIALNSANSYFTMENIMVDGAIGMLEGGAFHLSDSNSDITITGTTMKNCVSHQFGACMALGFLNTNILLTNSSCVDGWAHNYGGGVYADGTNGGNSFEIKDSEFTNCTAIEKGGGIFILTQNAVKITNTVLSHCRTQQPMCCGYLSLGGGLYAASSNDHLSLTNVKMEFCSSDRGGGLYLSKGNRFAQVTGSVIDSCKANQGGGMYLENHNDHMVIADTTIERCTADEGGGVYTRASTDLRFMRANISYNTAQGNGGGVYLSDNNDAPIVFECELTHNSANEFGGAIFSIPSTNGLAIAGSHFAYNSAGGSGGALALKGGNHNTILTDSFSANFSSILESPHPYVGGYTYNRVVDNPSVKSYILHFDPLTVLGPADFLTIRGPAPLGGGPAPVLFEGRSGSSFPGIDAPSLRVNTSFSVYMFASTAPAFAVILGDSIYGFKLYVAAIAKEPATPTVFEHNEARYRGGAIFTLSSVEYAVMVNAQVKNNFAVASGGGMYLSNAMTGLVMEASLFWDNEAAEDGGAIVVSSASCGWLVKDCDFYRNTAGSNGGAISFVTNNGKSKVLAHNNAITFKGCLFHVNVADNGGAIHADKENHLVLQRCHLQDNSAYFSGGAILVDSANTLTLSNSSLVGNTATEGGAIAGLVENEITLQGCRLTEGIAQLGGAIHIANGTQVEMMGDVMFANNFAGYVGGAISSFFAPLWTLKEGGSVYLKENEASRGSALYFRGLAVSSSSASLRTEGEQRDVYDLHDHHFDSNQAFIGGTVYWIYDSMMPSDPFSPVNVSQLWTGNIAPYGELLATQPVRVKGPQEYLATVFGTALDPPLTFTLYDHYGQDVLAESPTTIVATTLGATASQCKNRAPFLTGAGAEERAENGVVVFDSLVALCAPEGAFTLQFQAQLDLAELGDVAAYFIANRTEIAFRSCKTGEYIKDGMCKTCPIGTYSLESVVTEDTLCQDGTGRDGFKTCYADTIVTKADYWRRFNTSVSVLACSNEMSSCLGGNGTGDSLCTVGHEGPLCAVCSDGYYRDGQLCTVCEDQASIRPVTAFYLSIAGAVLAVCAFLFYTNCVDTADDVSVDNRKQTMVALVNGEDEELAPDYLVVDNGSVTTESAVPAKLSLREKLQAWVSSELESLKIKAKIVITTYQILSSIPSTTSVKFPVSFTKFLNAFDVFNLNIVSTVPLDCSGRYTFIDKLVFTTLGPIGAALALLALFVFEVLVKVRNPFQLGDDEVKKKKLGVLKDKYLTYFFFLTYFVLPSVSTTIFQTFLCTNVDPSDEDGASSDLFLTADMSISCTSDYYYKGVAYAIVMLLIYVVGIPMMYLALLYANREELMTRDDAPTTFEMSTQTEQEDLDGLTKPTGPPDQRKSSKNVKRPEPRVLSARAARLSFLWDAYEPKFWYWEVVETTRRLMLTAVLSVCGAGTSAQAIFAILLALMYIKLYGFYEPYVEDKDDFLAETGQFQIFFSFLGALIYQKALLGTSWNVGVSIALILINMAVSCIFTYYEVGGLVEQIREATGADAEPVEAEKKHLPLSDAGGHEGDGAAAAASHFDAEVDEPNKSAALALNGPADINVQFAIDADGDSARQPRPTPITAQESRTSLDDSEESFGENAGREQESTPGGIFREQRMASQDVLVNQTFF